MTEPDHGVDIGGRFFGPRLVTLALAVGVAALAAACEDDAPVAPGGPSPDAEARTTETQRPGARRDTLFGPRLFERETGPPRAETVTVEDGELAVFEGPFVLHLRNGTSDGEQRVSAARVWLDDELIFGPDDFSQQVGRLEHEVSLEAGSTLRVLVAGAPEGALEVWVEGTRIGAQARIGAEGGKVDFQGVAAIDVPADFFPTERTVLVTRAEDEEALEEFREFEAFFRVATRTSFQVRVLAGKSAPDDGDFEAVLTVPDDLEIPEGHRPELFARVFQDAGQEVLDKFHLFPSSWDPTTRTLTATLPNYVFTEARREDGLAEAIFMIGTTPGTQGTVDGSSSSSLVTQQAGGPEQCEAGFIGCPLAGGCSGNRVASEFGERPDPETGKREKHWGTDFGVENGTEVRAAADGEIQRAAVPGGNFAPDDDGYGRYLILRQEDGSATLYAHLQEAAVGAGENVERGELLALSDNTGRSTGPHLHLEYVPNGQIIQSKERIDPFACIQDRTVEGAISVRDNGNLADDAFSVFFDGLRIGTTDVGAANTFALNNVIPGDHTLRLTGVVVPDDVGTWEIVFSQGITFSDGSVRKSGVVGLDESVSFGIVVPEASVRGFVQSVSPQDLMRPNEVIEGTQE